MADYLIIISTHVSKFTGESGFPGINLTINNNSDTYSPAYIHKNDIFFSFHAALHIFAISHGTRVIINGYFISQFFG